MTTLYNQIKEELMIVETVNNFNIPPLYLTNDLTEQKVKTTYKALLRASQLKNRMLTLVNAFYLGQIIETETLSPAEHTQYRNTMTLYYRQASKRTFYLFKTLGVEQIGCSKQLTLRMIYNLKA
ncbi:14700_t:CDS:1 [Funneliformis geosporum]|uniref:14700_t:CDS:1 n=1 Tax=Funneliformis geosporum TaxID=1117311 RepID=A0A9W4T9M5_9GLOM|nr:14700_t:CDS:1 [Funneliformis geosporum]